MPPSPAPRVLFAGLVDDAALFPPGNAPMQRALAEHAVHRSGWYADLVGPFVCPASRLGELRETLPAGQKLRVALVFDVTGDPAHQALRAVAADDRLTLVAVEAAQARLGTDAGVVGENLRRLPDTTGYLEVPRTGFDDGLDLVARGGWRGAKYRTGGASADSFPSPAELAAFIAAGVERGLPFKLTAGLHHAVRHTGDTTRFEHHGVLNVLAATAAALASAGTGVLADLLAERRAEPLAERTRGLSEGEAVATRAAFRSFGCCGVTDPLGDLAGLGLIEEAT